MIKLKDLLNEKTIAMGQVHSNPYATSFKTEQQIEEENEGKMAKYDAKEIAEDAIDVFKMIDEKDDLPEWLEAKITKAADYMNSVKDYLSHQMGKEKN